MAGLSKRRNCSRTLCAQHLLTLEDPILLRLAIPVGLSLWRTSNADEVEADTTWYVFDGSVQKLPLHCLSSKFDVQDRRQSAWSSLEKELRE